MCQTFSARPFARHHLGEKCIHNTWPTNCYNTSLGIVKLSKLLEQQSVSFGHEPNEFRIDLQVARPNYPQYGMDGKIGRYRNQVCAMLGQQNLSDIPSRKFKQLRGTKKLYAAF